jgi:hypothetical protein
MPEMYAHSTTLCVVPLPRFAGEDPRSRPVAPLILPRSWGIGIAEGGGGGADIDFAEKL